MKMFNRILSSPLVNQYALVVIVNLNILGAGMCLSWPSPVLVKLMNPDESVLGRAVTVEEGGWIVSIGLLVGGIANFIPALILDHLGRKYSLILATIPKAIAAFMLIFGTELWIILLARSLFSIGDMSLFTVVPIYASEIASKEIRGSLGIILQVMSAIGIVIMLSLGPFISYSSVNILSAVVVVVAMLPLTFLPDSPYFLYTKGRNEEALRVLTFLRGSENAAKEELKEYAREYKPESFKKMSLFTNKTFLKTFALVLVIIVASQMIGFNAIQLYLQTILESTHTSVGPEIASAILGVLQLVASILSLSITDKFGRKPILAWSLIVMMFGMIGLGTFFKISEKAGAVTGYMNYLPIMSLVVVVVGFSTGPASVIWPLTSELLDGHARATGISISNSIACLLLFLVTRFFAPVVTAIGPAATYWGFSAVCLLFSLFIVFFIPETKGKSFAEIQKALGVKNINDEEKPEK